MTGLARIVVPTSGTVTQRECDIRAQIWYDAPMRKSIFHRLFKLGPLQLHIYVPPRSRRPGRGIQDGMIPAVPDRPKNLSGGAAAALEFDD